MPMTEGEFLQFLDAHDFAYRRIEHPAVFTCEEAELHRPKLPAVSTKNLFLCDKKKRHFFLVVTACEKTVRLDGLSTQLGSFSFAFWVGSGSGAIARCGARFGDDDGAGERFRTSHCVVD